MWTNPSETWILVMEPQADKGVLDKQTLLALPTFT